RGAGAPELDQDRLADSHWMPGVDCDEVEEEGAETGEGIHLDGAAEFPPGRESLQDSLRIMVAELFESKKPQYTIAVIGVGLRVFAEGRGWIHKMAQYEVRKAHHQHLHSSCHRRHHPLGAVPETRHKICKGPTDMLPHPGKRQVIEPNASTLWTTLKVA
ncbi:hypothetical protein N8813_05510, partial [bacterium]|nr:hypothetical protein [bacterium]